MSSHTTGDKVIIGHAGGVITIDVVISLDDYRESLRVKLGEPYRTMLGHFAMRWATTTRTSSSKPALAQSDTSMAAGHSSVTSG